VIRVKGVALTNFPLRAYVPESDTYQLWESC
jgi:hypothetical protein